MLALIPLIPFAGFLVNAFLGKRLPKSVSGGLATAAMFISFAIAVTQVLALMGMPSESRQIIQTLYTWITAGDFTLDLALRLDALSAVMILVITGIGSLIHLYSTSYMHEETDADYAGVAARLNIQAFILGEATNDNTGWTLKLTLPIESWKVRHFHGELPSGARFATKDGAWRSSS